MAASNSKGPAVSRLIWKRAAMATPQHKAAAGTSIPHRGMASHHCILWLCCSEFTFGHSPLSGLRLQAHRLSCNAAGRHRQAAFRESPDTAFVHCSGRDFPFFCRFWNHSGQRLQYGFHRLFINLLRLIYSSQAALKRLPFCFNLPYFGDYENRVYTLYYGQSTL